MQKFWTTYRRHLVSCARIFGTLAGIVLFFWGLGWLWNVLNGGTISLVRAERLLLLLITLNLTVPILTSVFTPSAFAKDSDAA